MRLNDTIIRNTKPGPTLQKLSDGDGLYLFVQPNGARWWRMRYFVNGVEKMLSVGVYPEVSLKEARQRREDIRRKVATKVDPSEGRKAEKRARADTFESIAREWWEKRRKLWSEMYAGAVMTRFEQDIFPFIGKKPVKTLTAADFLDCLERMQKRGVIETAHKVKTKCSEVMRYATATRRAERDPVVDLKGALQPGYTKDEMTGHGFRSMASTLLNEEGWYPDAIERQLAHCEEDDVRAAYNYAEYLPERRKMMQWWADYLDGLRADRKQRATASPSARMHSLHGADTRRSRSAARRVGSSAYSQHASRHR